MEMREGKRVRIERGGRGTGLGLKMIRNVRGKQNRVRMERGTGLGWKGPGMREGNGVRMEGGRIENVCKMREGNRRRIEGWVGEQG